MPVTSEHELYVEYKEDWEEVRDCVKGNRAIKKKREQYLPMLSGQLPEDYNRYLKKVKFFGATGRTLEGLHGNIFRKAPEYTGEVSEIFMESLNNVDLMGTNIEQFVSNIMNDNLPTNWGGILVDYPKGDEAASLADAEKKGLKAYLKYYPAECVINWEYKTISGKTKLSMVVLIESYTEKNPNDKFVSVKYKKYRVLYLDPNNKNKYRQEIYDEKISLEVPNEKEIIIKMNGEEMDDIPFFPIPGNLPEKSMLYDLAQLNLQHYQDRADYQNGKHYTSIPTPIGIGVKPELDDNGKPIPMFIGGTQFQFFPNEDHVPGADVKYLEFTGKGMEALSEGIIHLESLMAILGAHIIAAEKKGVETAEALRIHRIGENGVLSTYTRNVSNSVTMALRVKGQWDGEDINKLNKWAINFNTDYDLSDENIQTLTALLTGRSTGEVPRMSVYLGLKALNLIPEQWDFDTFILELEKDAHDKLPEIEEQTNIDKSKSEDEELNDENEEDDKAL
jgi:hypothetical protein